MNKGRFYEVFPLVPPQAVSINPKTLFLFPASPSSSRVNSCVIRLAVRKHTAEKSDSDSASAGPRHRSQEPLR